jgi:hypothetical protein
MLVDGRDVGQFAGVDSGGEKQQAALTRLRLNPPTDLDLAERSSWNEGSVHGFG